MSADQFFSGLLKISRNKNSSMNRNFLEYLILSNFALFLFWLAVTTTDLEGDQVLHFYWVDPIDAGKWFILKPHDCAFVPVLWEYDKDAPAAKLFWICLNISNYSNLRCFAQKIIAEKTSAGSGGCSLRQCSKIWRRRWTRAGRSRFFAHSDRTWLSLHPMHHAAHLTSVFLAS